MSDLLNCPFCGGKPKMYYPFHLMGKPGHAATYHGGVRCSQCGCESRATTPTDDSISSWNARADLPSDAAQAPMAVAWVVEENEEPRKKEYPRTLDWYASEIAELPVGTKLYAAPVATAAPTLTDEVLHDLYRAAFSCQYDYNEFKREARAILATHQTK